MFRSVPAPAGIDCPVLVLLSSSGTFADPGRMQGLIDAFPHGQTLKIDCHHWPLTERPTEVRQAIEAWIGSLDASLSAAVPD